MQHNAHKMHALAIIFKRKRFFAFNIRGRAVQITLPICPIYYSDYFTAEEIFFCLKEATHFLLRIGFKFLILVKSIYRLVAELLFSDDSGDL